MNRRLVRVIVVASRLSACRPSLGGVPDKAAARRVCDRAMAKVLADDVSGAFELLKAEMGMVLPEMETMVLQTVTQRAAAASRFGKAVGVTFIKEEEIADVMLRLTYVEKRDNHGYRWQFIFYKPVDRWYLDGIKWDDKLELLFEP